MKSEKASATYSITFNRDRGYTYAQGYKRVDAEYKAGQKYRVPEDVPHNIAQQALRAGDAVKVMPTMEKKRVTRKRSTA